MPEKKASLEMSAVDWSIEIEAIAGPYSGNRKSWLAKAARNVLIRLTPKTSSGREI